MSHLALWLAIALLLGGNPDMKIKHGVSFIGMVPQISAGMSVTETVYRTFGAELVVTSVGEGKHKRSSAHFTGRAFDARIWVVPDHRLNELVRALKAALGPEFDVVLESDHIHIEWDPKKGSA